MGFKIWPRYELFGRKIYKKPWGFNGATYSNMILFEMNMTTQK